MEALIAVFGEALGAITSAIAAPLSALVAAIADAVLMALYAVGSAVLGFIRSQRQRQATGSEAPSTGTAASSPASTAPSASRQTPASSPWRRRLTWATAILAGLGLLAVVLLQTVVARPLVERAIARIGERTGLVITWRSLEVNALAGHLVLRDLHVVRPDHPRLTCDLRVAEADLDAALWSCLWGDLRLESVRITDVQGTLAQHLGPREPRPGWRSWTMARLEVRDVAVDATIDRAGQAFRAPCRIDLLECQPLSGRRVLFDLLLRSRMTGSIGDATVAIASTPQDRGRLTTWQARRLPARLVAVSLGGIFAGMQDGTLDVDVDDAWSWDAPRFLHMDYRVTTHGLRLAEDWKPAGIAAKALPTVRAWLDGRKGDVDLRFALDADPERFTSGLSPDAIGMGDWLGPAVAAVVARACGLPEEAVRTLAPAAIGVGKELIELWRKQGLKP